MTMAETLQHGTQCAANAVLLFEKNMLGDQPDDEADGCPPFPTRTLSVRCHSLDRLPPHRPL